MSSHGQAERTLLVTVDSLRYDHYQHMQHTRAALGESHPQAFATSTATAFSFQSIIGGYYPRAPGLAEDESVVNEFADVHTFGYQSNPLLTTRYGYAQGFDEYTEPERTESLKDKLASHISIGNGWAYRLGATVVNNLQRLTAQFGEVQREYIDAGTLIDELIHDVEQHGDAEETSWFAWLHLMEPHHPYNPSSEWSDMPRAEAQILTRKVLAGQATPEEEDRVRDLYKGEVQETDAELARLWEWVPEDTRIVFAADHGELLGESDKWGHFQHFSPEIMHIPFATRNTPETQGEVVSLVDIPTLLTGVEFRDGTFDRDLAFAANQGVTAVTDGTTIVSEKNVFHLGDEDKAATARLQRELGRFSVDTGELNAEDHVDMEDLKDLGYA